MSSHRGSYHVTGKPSSSKKRKALDSIQLGTNNRTSPRKTKKNRDIADSVGQDTTLSVDYISGLPEHIIHQILALLPSPKAIARTSVLSTKWRTIWMSFLTFDFDQKYFKAQRKSKKVEFAEFVQFVESSLLTRLTPLEVIQKFNLSMTSFNEKKMTPRLDSWVASAVSRNVREIEIRIHTKKLRRYRVPRSILSSQSLITLKLDGCKFVVCDNLKFSNLQQFSMKNMRIDANIIQCFINNCPLIEDLRLARCTGLNSLQISTNVKLNTVEIHECAGLYHVEVSAPNLQTFWFCAMGPETCTIDLKECHDLRRLTLKDTKMTDTLFQDLISKFPVLETLVLRDCSSLKRVVIFSGKLRMLSLLRCSKLTAAVVDAPKLLIFDFTGHKMPVLSINAPNLCDAKIRFTGKSKKKFNVKEVFGRITELKDLKLVLQRNKDVTVYEELVDGFPDIQFSASKDFDLLLKGSSFSLIKHMNTMLLSGHPTAINVVSKSSSDLVKFLLDKTLNREKSLTCCAYSVRKCWQHYLEDVTINVRRGRESDNETLKKTTFLLEWGSVEVGK